MNIFQLYFQKQRLLLEALTKTKVLFLVLIVSQIIWILFFTYVYFSRTTKEPERRLEAPSAIDKNLKLGLEVLSFTKFDINKDEFSIDAHLYIDFDPRNYSIEDFAKFHFQRGQVVARSKPTLEPAGDLMRATYEITVNFKSQIKYADFPFDQHRVDIVLMDVVPEQKQVFLAKENLYFILDSTILGAGWNLVQTVLDCGFPAPSQIETDENPNDYKVVFSLYTNRSSPKTPILVLMPLLLLFFLQLISLTFEVTKDLPSLACFGVVCVPSATFTQKSSAIFKSHPEGISPSVVIFQPFGLSDKALASVGIVEV